MLNQITRGVPKKPYFITIYGPPGVGKTTYGCRMPDPIFICTEDGLPENADGERVAHFPKPKDFNEIISRLVWLRDTKTEFKTLCIDSLDHMESLVFDQVCRDHNNAKNIELVGGGYGKGYKIAKDYWRQFFMLINSINESMNVLLICHSRIKAFSDPSLAENYDRHELKLNEQAADLVREHSRALFFMNFKSALVETGSKVRGFSDGSVRIYTQYRAHHEGKNRYNLPYEIGNEFKDFEALAKSGTRSKADVISEIQALSSRLADETVKQKVQLAVDKAGDSMPELSAILKRLTEITGA